MHIQKKIRLVLVRHGESLWNKLNIYTGWSNPNLTPKGIEECNLAAKIIASQNFKISNGYSSYLQRSIDTYNLIFEEIFKLNGIY